MNYNVGHGISLHPCTSHARQPDLTPREDRQDDPRRSAPHRGERAGRAARSAHRAAGGRRRAAGREAFHRRGARAGARPGGGRQPHAGAGAGRRGAPRTDAPDGRGERRARSRGCAAGGDPDGRPAGLGQDHHRRQARAAAEGPEEEGADGFLRRLPPRRDRAVEDGGRAGGRGISLLLMRTRNPKRSQERPSSMPAPITATSSSSIPRAAWRSTSR